MCLSIELNRPEDVLGRGEHVGFEWRVIHNRMGYRCGYIRVPPGHPWHGRDYNEIPAEVHGGLTFSDDVPCEKGGEDNGYWLGFDCAHAGDSPDPDLPAESFSVLSLLFGSDRTVATQKYVENQCRELCEQAKAAANVT